jgi:hypothetical protein
MALRNQKPLSLADRNRPPGKQSRPQVQVKLALSRRQVTYEEAETFARNNGFDYYEVSALTGEKVSDVFSKMTQTILNKILNRELNTDG